MMNNKLVARGRMGSYELTEGRKEHFYVPTPLGTELSAKAVSDNLDGIHNTLLNFYDQMKSELASLKAMEAFPIGSTFISIDDINPKTRLGYGDWVLISEGRTLVGAGAGKVLGATGGSATVALTEAQMPSHKHDVYVGDLHASVVTDVQGGVRQTDWQGEHIHDGRNYKSSTGSEVAFNASGSNVNTNATTNPVNWNYTMPAGGHAHNIDISHAHNVNISHGHGVGEAHKGGNAPINIENPYLVVNIWHRVS